MEHDERVPFVVMCLNVLGDAHPIHLQPADEMMRRERTHTEGGGGGGGVGGGGVGGGGGGGG